MHVATICLLIYLLFGTFIMEITEVYRSESWKTRVFGSMAITIFWLPIVLYAGIEAGRDYWRDRRAHKR